MSAKSEMQQWAFDTLPVTEGLQGGIRELARSAGAAGDSLTLRAHAAAHGPGDPAAEELKLIHDLMAWKAWTVALQRHVQAASELRPVPDAAAQRHFRLSLTLLAEFCAAIIAATDTPAVLAAIPVWDVANEEMVLFCGEVARVLGVALA